MSTTSGIGNKGDKSKKYKGFDINTVYKGKSLEPQKSAAPRQHGLQSLGKVSSLRRMPPPANLPSLKSENSGNDPSVSLVPSGGSGWKLKEEKESGGGGQPQLSQLQQVASTPSQNQQIQAPVATKTTTQPGGQSSTVRSWSTITGGIQQGGLVSHQSPLFQEEFPTLAQEDKNKEAPQTTKKEEDPKDTQYGPGPSLRPQNVASWREGGGRAVPQAKTEEAAVNTPNLNPTEAQQNGLQTSGGVGVGLGNVGHGPSPPPGGPSRPDSGHGLPQPTMSMGHLGMPPPHNPQYRGMMPPYMYGRPPHGNYQANYTGFNRPPFHDPRFRGPPPHSMPRHRGDGEDLQKRAAILSDKQLKEFDQILKTDGNEPGWAGPQGEIDYSEKLVFSDDEDDSKRSRGKQRAKDRHPEHKDASRDYIDEFDEKADNFDSEQQKDVRDKNDDQAPMVREAWPHGPPRYRGPRPPHLDNRGWPAHVHPFDYMGHRGAPPFGFRMPPPPQMRPPYVQPPPSTASSGNLPPRKQGEDEEEMWRMKRRVNEGEINTAVERARQRREEEEKRKDNELKAAAAEKLRQLDERSKKKEEGKDSDNERRSSRTASESSDKDSIDSRQKERSTSYNTVQGDHASASKGYARQVPPRFQKQEALANVPSGQRQQPPSPGAGGPPLPAGPIPQGYRPRQGHPPPPWGHYGNWGPIPPFIDPRYGPRPPIDMQGMYGAPPMPRRRHDSQEGPSNDGQDVEDIRHPEQSDRPIPHSQWMERGYPPHPGHFDEMRRYPYIDQRAYQERYAFERRDYERQDDDRSSVLSESERSQKDLDQRPPPLMHDSYEEHGKAPSDKEDKKTERSNSKNSSDWDQKSFKDSKDESFDDEFGEKSGKENVPEEPPEEVLPPRGYRRDGRQGPTPTFRAYSSEERSRREAIGKSETGSSNGPPPLLETNTQGALSKSSLTSLKRSASNMSSSSATSSDKDKEKKDSPKESLIFERSTLKKEMCSKLDHDKDKQEKSPEPQEQARPNVWETKDNERAKTCKEQEVIPFLKDDAPKEHSSERVGSPLNNRPPVKKKREDDQEKERREIFDDSGRRDKEHDRFEKGERTRITSSRGREFVRGRGGSRSRGRSSGRGTFGQRPSRNKDYYSANYERSQGGGRSQRKVERPNLKPDGSKSDESDGNEYPSRSKHGLRVNDTNQLEDPDKDDKEQEKKERRENTMSSRDRNPSSQKDNSSWSQTKDSRNAYVAAPPPSQNPWNRESKPLLPLPTPRTDWSTEMIGKEGASVWNQRLGPLDKEVDRHRGNPETERVDHRNRRQDRDNRRRQDRDNGRRDKDEVQENDDKKFDHKDRDRRNRDNDQDRERRNRDNDQDRERRNRDNDQDRDKRTRDNDQRTRDLDQRHDGNVFVPRGEPSRRGRGGGRSNRGSGRYTSAPSGRGGGGAHRSDSYGNQNGMNSNGKQTFGGRDNRTNYDAPGQRRDIRRQDNRNQPPPRFSRTNNSSEARGRGTDRGSGGRGRSNRGRGGSAPANLTKKPVLTKQASNDGEEWETASESSEPKNDSRESRDKKETSVKKSSNQRQFNDRQQSSRRLNNQDSRNSVERRDSNKEKQNPKNGMAPPTKSAANGNDTAASATNNVGHKESVVYRVDNVIPSDPNAITNALSNLQNKKQSVKKVTEVSESPKPAKIEKEKKDALADIDLNNYASVVVIDDQPEVSVGDPDQIFESNEGFQEVTSKKTMKTKQKQIDVEPKRPEKETQKRKDHSNKVVARPKGLTPKAGRVGAKGAKLPPRLAKQKEIREKEKEMSKNTMPKIELWDNELANNIPSPLETKTLVVSSATDIDISMDDIGDLVPSTTIIINAKPNMTGSMALAPAPTPTTNAWSKPFRFPASVGQVSQPSENMHQVPQHAVHVNKPDKGDQHDSGIDVSDRPNSTSSSTRSSPSADNKLISTNTLLSSAGKGFETNNPEEIISPDSAPKETAVVICKELTESKPDPIQMPPSFKNSIFSKDEGSALQLDFNYDESLDEQSGMPNKVDDASVHNEDICLTTSGPIASPTSPATEDLSSKIASVKNFWDPLPSSFEQATITPSSSGTSNDNRNGNASPATSGTPTYHGFGRDVGGIKVGVGVLQAKSPSPSQMDDNLPVMPASSIQVNPAHSPNLQGLQHSSHSAESNLMRGDLEDSVLSEHEVKVSMMEPTNVCKVRPQQLQLGTENESECNSPVLSSAITGSLPTVASPPMMLTNQAAFQIPIGSQFMPQDQRQYTQPSYGFSMTQTQGPGSLRGQHQRPLAPQQSFSQASFIVPSTPTQHGELFSSPLAFHSGFAQPAAAPPPVQPSTMMVSSTSSSMMSSNIKSQGPTHGTAQGLGSGFNPDSLNKNLSHNQLYSGLGSGSVPGTPSQQLYYYDPHPQPLSQLFQPTAHSQLLGGNQQGQNLNNSQIIGSQLIPTRAPVQASSSFYQPAQAMSYFQTQQPNSAVQGPVQQVTNGHQFPVQAAAFSNQTHGLGLALPPTGPSALDSGLSQAPSNMALHHTQSIGPNLQPAQHAAVGQIAPQSTNKNPHLGTVVAAAVPQQTPQHMGHLQQQQLHVLGSSQANQMKSPLQNNNLLYNANQNTSNLGHGLMKAQHIGVSQGGNMGPSSGGMPGMSSTAAPGIAKNIGSNSLSAGDGSNRMGTGGVPPAVSSSMHTFASTHNSMSTPAIGSNTVRNGPGHSRFPNPNAPNFPPSNKFSGGFSKAPTPPSQSIQPVTSISGQPLPQVPGNQVRPQMMMGNVLRNSAPMQGPNHPRQPFPNPIQRPGSPSNQSTRPPSNMMNQAAKPSMSKPHNMVSGGQNPVGNNRPNPGPLNLGNMNLGNSNIISNMILNAANVISQTVGSQLAMQQGVVPTNPNNPFTNKGFNAGPPSNSRDAMSRPGNPSPQSISKPTCSQNTLPPYSHPKQAPGSYPGPTLSSNPDNLKAQQAQQRRALLTHAANFLNNNKAGSQNASSQKQKEPVSGEVPAQPPSSSKEDEKKPPLPMVSNPGLVGTSIKIDLSASNNSRAPAVSGTLSYSIASTTSSGSNSSTQGGEH